jgi:asparagine synthase (glutamine-hydrolysing)
MCAIAGLFDTRGSRPIDEALLHRMNDRQRHRGPDGHGVHMAPGAGLAHRRLSIIDLEGGGQPQYNEDGSVAVVFNGEIYNYRALRSELQARGHRFATASDTEVIVHGWEEWQEGVVDQLRGMFAFAILDQPQQRLLLARDRLGVKPLFYALLPEGVLIFASELKALLEHPGLPRALDPRRVEDFFAFGYVPDPGTILRSVCKLEPVTCCP